MNKIIAIAALITIALAAYGASAGPYDSAGSFPSNYAHSQKNRFRRRTDRHWPSTSNR